MDFAKLGNVFFDKRNLNFKELERKSAMGGTPKAPTVGTMYR